MSTLKKTTTAAVIDVGTVKPSTVITNRRDGLALVTPLQTEIDTFVKQGIQSPEDYATADALFGRVKTARKTWKLKMYGTKDAPGPIPSIKSGLDQLYELNREVDKPLEALELAIEQPMKAFKLAELREKNRIEQERQQAERAAQDKIDALSRKQEEMKTPAAKARIEQQIVEVAEELDAAQQQEAAPASTVGLNSAAKPRKMPVLVSEAQFKAGVLRGLIPDDCITINMVKVRQYYKDDPESVAEFPGIEIQDDVQIAGR